MALIIEDGTGVSGANSYVTDAEYIAYVLEVYGVTVTSNEPALLRAMAYMNSLKWYGVKTYGRAQSTAWPRKGVSDCDGFSILSNEIPAEVVKAQCELAYAEATATGVLTPQVSVAGVVSREKVDVIEVEYDTSQNTGNVDDQRVTVTAALDLLRCFYNSSRFGASAFVV